jgi:arsenate reductase
VLPVLPGKSKKMFHQEFPDHAKAKGTEEEIAAAFRKVRNSIKKFSEKFISGNLL